MRKQQGFDRIDFNFEVISTLGKMPLNSIAYAKKSFVKRESVEMGNFTVVFFKKLPQSPRLQQPSPHQSVIINIKAKTLNQQKIILL